MKNTPFDNLQYLIGRLKPHEVRNTRSYLGAFMPSSKTKASKSILVFDTLVSKKKITEAKLYEKYFEGIKLTSFNKQLSRLQDKILDALVLDVNVDRQRSEVYSPYVKKTIDLNGKILQLRIAIGRGLDDIAQKLLKDIERDGVKYELYTELITALRIGKSFGLNKGVKEFRKYQKKIDKVVEEQLLFEKAKHNYYLYYIDQDFHGKRDEKIGFLSEVLSEMGSSFKKTNSANIGFLYYVLLIEFQSSMEDYPAIKQTTADAIKLIETSPAIYQKSKISNIQVRQIENFIKLYVFDQAIDLSKTALNGFVKGSLNYNKTLERKCQSKFFMGNYEELIFEIDEILVEPNIKTNILLANKFNYLRASALFCQRKFNESYRVLGDTQEMNEDKEGWNLGIRILIIMNLVERQKLDTAEMHVQAAVRFVDRLKKEKEFAKRDITIVKILNRLYRKGFIFKEVYRYYKKELALLASAHPDYMWRIDTPEMIVFHQWFEAKLHNKPYQFIVPAFTRSDENLVTPKTQRKKLAPVVQEVKAKP